LQGIKIFNINTDNIKVTTTIIIHICIYKSVEGFSNLYVQNFYGEDLNAGNGVGAFTLNQGSTIEIK